MSIAKTDEINNSNDNEMNYKTAPLSRFLQEHTVNLQSLANYAVHQIPTHIPPLRRNEILVFIALYAKLTHNALSHRQISFAFSLSKTTIQNHLLRLESDGRIQVIDGRIKIVGSSYTISNDLLLQQ